MQNNSHIIDKIKSLIQDLVELGGSKKPRMDKGEQINVLLESIRVGDAYRVADNQVFNLRELPVLVEVVEPYNDESPLDSGMRGYLYGIEWSHVDECYKGFLDMMDFSEHNALCMKESYYPNDETRKKVASGSLADKPLYTALEAGKYNIVETLFFSVKKDGKWVDHRADAFCADTLIGEYFRIIEKVAN